MTAPRTSKTTQFGGTKAVNIAQTESPQESTGSGTASGSGSRLPAVSNQSLESPRQVTTVATDTNAV